MMHNRLLNRFVILSGAIWSLISTNCKNKPIHTWFWPKKTLSSIRPEPIMKNELLQHSSYKKHVHVKDKEKSKLKFPEKDDKV